MTPLRDYILDVYGGFADRRHKDPALDRPIRVDDQCDRDIYPGFCTVSVSVPDRGSNDLILKLLQAPRPPLRRGRRGVRRRGPSGRLRRHHHADPDRSSRPGHQAAGQGDQGGRRPGPELRRPQPPMDLPPHRRLPREVGPAPGPLPRRAWPEPGRQEARSHSVAASRFRRARTPRQAGPRHEVMSPPAGAGDPTPRTRPVSIVLMPESMPPARDPVLESSGAPRPPPSDEPVRGSRPA